MAKLQPENNKWHLKRLVFDSSWKGKTEAISSAGHPLLVLSLPHIGRSPVYPLSHKGSTG